MAEGGPLHLRLHFVPKTRATRARWALEEAGLAYELRLLDIGADEQRSDAYRRIHPLAKVPALEVDGVPMFESAAIVVWACDLATPAPLAPRPDAPERRAYLTWVFYATTTLDPLVEGLAAARRSGDSDRVARAVEALREPLQVVDRAVAGSSWLLGDAFTGADIVLASVVRWAMALDAGLVSPAVTEWVRRCFARPAARRAIS
jgi:glutathione S-transferase